MNSKLKEIFGPNFDLSNLDFIPKQANVSLLSSNLFESDKLFKSLKTELEQFQAERKRPLDRQKLHPGKSLEWKEHFYHALQSLLCEVLFEQSADMKQGLLQKISKWYTDKTGKSAMPEPPVYFTNIPEEKNLEVYIPQKIEPTVAPRPCKIHPFLPGKLRSATNDVSSSKESLFKVLLTAEQKQTVQLPKVRNDKKSREVLLRPYSPSKDNSEAEPVVKDFRTTSRAKSTRISRNFSPDTFRKTRYLPYETNIQNASYFSAVPDSRRVQIKEVIKIKSKLASKRVVCPVKILEGGLVISDFTLDPIPPSSFPRGDELLMRMPRKNKKPLKSRRKKGKKK